MPTAQSNRYFNAMQMLEAGHIALTIQSIRMLEPEEQIKATSRVYDRLLETGDVNGFVDFFLKSKGYKLTPSPSQLSKLLTILVELLSKENIPQHREVILSVYEVLHCVGMLPELIDLAQDLRRLFGQYVPTPTQAQLLTAYHYALQYQNKDLSQKLHDRYQM